MPRHRQKKTSPMLFKKNRQQKPNTFQLRGKLRFQPAQQPCPAKHLRFSVYVRLSSPFQSLLSQACHARAQSRCLLLRAEAAVMLPAGSSSLPTAVLTLRGVLTAKTRRESNDREARQRGGNETTVTWDALDCFQERSHNYPVPALAKHKGFMDVMRSPHQV